MLMLTDYMREGGLFMWAVLGFGGLAGLSSLVMLIVLALGKRPPAVLWLVLPGLVLVAGVLGMYDGRSIIDDAFVSAMPEERQVFFAMGISISLFVEGMMRLVGMLTFSFLALSAGIGSLVGLRGERGRSTLPIGLGAAVLLLLGAGGSTAWGALRLLEEFGASWSLAAGILGVFLAATYIGAGLRAEADVTRRSNDLQTRALVVIGVALATWCAAGVARVSGTIMTFKAVAAASAVDKAQMAEAGIEFSRADGMPGWVAVGGALVGGAVLIIPCLSGVGPGWLAKTGAAAMVLAGVALLGLVCSAQVLRADMDDVLTEILLPREVQSARFACASTMTKQTEFTVFGELQIDGSLKDLRVETDGAGSSTDAATRCLRDQFAAARLDMGYGDPSWWTPQTTRWTFDLPPDARVQSLVGDR